MISDRLRLVVMMVPALAAMSLFSEMHMLGLIALVLGSVMVLLGKVAENRPIAVLGLLVVTGVATATVTVDSLGSFQAVITASVGLVAPLFVLVWISFSSEPDRPALPAPSRRPAALAVVYVTTCVLSVPAAAVLVGLAFPSLSQLFTGLLEVSMISLVAVFGAIIAVSVEPKGSESVE